MTSDLQEAREYRRLVRDRLNAQTEGFVQFLRLIAATPVPADAARVVIAIFDDWPTGPFPAQLAYVTHDERETGQDIPNVSRIHSRLSSFGPLIDPEELEAISWWVEGEDGNAELARVQPYDDVDMVGDLILPFMVDCAKRAPLDGFAIPIHAGAADGRTPTQVLYAPAPPEKPSLLKRFLGR